MQISSEAQVAEAVAEAREPLSIRGGGTRGLAPEGEPLSVAGLRGITLYEPGALTMVAQAGTSLSEIAEALAAENQRLAFEPPDHRAILGTEGTPTIGGLFAANLSGPRRIAVGAARDFLLGVRFVDGTGAIVKNGGRVMKNVTGYDLVKLLAGSHGTLGVLTEVSFKVLPSPETEATLTLSGQTEEAAIAALCRAMGSPFEVTGAAHDPARGETYLRVEGFADSVSYRIDRLKALLRENGAEMTVQEAEGSATLWRAQRNLAPLEDVTGDLWRLSCKPTEGPALARRAEAARHLCDWAGGLLWLVTEPGTDLRARLGAYEGHATLLRASPETRQRLGTFEPEAPGVARLTEGLRRRFDPRGIFNPGLMAPAA